MSTLESSKKGIYVDTEQSSLLVFPNGMYGINGFKHYYEESTTKINNKQIISYKIKNNILKKELEKAFKTDLRKIFS